MKYEFEDGMIEISGMGGDYETVCRTLLKSGLEWFDEHPDANPKFEENGGIFGIIFGENDDAEALLEITGGFSSAVQHAVIQHVMWIHKNGWDAYIKEMKVDE